ncbi:MAG: ankyrin repeat domain-containing protein [Pleurocapsa sp.]
MRSHHQPEDIVADKYQIVGILGEGNSGITYQAKDLINQRQIALKAMSLHNINDWKLVELFDREAKILAKLDHPNIPSYLDYFQIDSTNNRAFYIAQELAQGQSLASLVETGWHKSEAEIKEIAIELLKILVYIHLQKPAVIHTDIKTQNIIRHDDGKIFLVDFGAVGHTYHNTMMRGSTVVGTYGYMAPEQFRGQAFTATDLYGLGATLLYLLTHRSPAELPTDRLRIDFRNHIQVSEEFGDWLEKILESDMSDRFPSAAAALDALQPKKISLTKSVSWQAIVLMTGIGIGAFFATRSLIHQKYAVFNKLGLTPHVHAAIYQNAIDIPDYLAKCGNVNGKDKQGKTLLHYAVENNKLDLIEFLIANGADVNQLDINGNSALYEAIRQSNFKLITLLKNNQANLNSQDLEQLGLELHTKICDPEKVRFLLRHGANANQINISGSTPLLKIANTECAYTSRGRGRQQVDVAKLLIEVGADVNAQNREGKTPLHLIKTSYGEKDYILAQLFIKAGAFLDITDQNNQTPLHIAAKNGRHDLAKVLIKAGADINAQDNQGQTPLHIVTHNSSHGIKTIQRLFIESGADIFIADNTGKTNSHLSSIHNSHKAKQNRLLQKTLRKEEWEQRKKEIERQHRKRKKEEQKWRRKHNKNR